MDYISVVANWKQKKAFSILQEWYLLCARVWICVYSAHYSGGDNPVRRSHHHSVSLVPPFFLHCRASFDARRPTFQFESFVFAAYVGKSWKLCRFLSQERFQNRSNKILNSTYFYSKQTNKKKPIWLMGFAAMPHFESSSHMMYLMGDHWPMSSHRRSWRRKRAMRESTGSTWLSRCTAGRRLTQVASGEPMELIYN